MFTTTNLNYILEVRSLNWMKFLCQSRSCAWIRYRLVFNWRLWFLYIWIQSWNSFDYFEWGKKKIILMLRFLKSSRWPVYVAFVQYYIGTYNWLLIRISWKRWCGVISLWTDGPSGKNCEISKNFRPERGFYHWCRRLLRTQ